MKKLVIVGGGTAGWLTAAYLKKFNTDLDITLIESPDIPKIGVGESVTPHVAAFFHALGIDDFTWMKFTGSIHKYANKFINWKTGNGEYEYFSFSYPTDVKLLLNEIDFVTQPDQWRFGENTVRTTDTFIKLNFDKFDKYWNSQFYYMEKNVSPFDERKYLLNTNYSYAQHINADMAAEFIRDRVAKPHGVKHIQSKIKDIILKSENQIDHVVLEDDTEHKFDFYVDASGFSRVLIKKLGWEFKEYKNNPINSAYVCQTDYSDPETEMVNYTQSIAEPCGWRFKIGLYHRMGNGYCFSNKHITNEKALDYLNQQVNLKRKQPRLLTWTPERLVCPAQGNVAALGLSAGFVEPLEANALYTIVNSIRHLSEALHKNNFKDYNKKVNASIDDIADFILVHYTLSSRTDTDFWNDMREIGIKENHKELVYQKYMNKYNTIYAALEGYTLFPEYMWAQLAHSWDLDMSKWTNKQFNQLDLDLTKLHFESLEKKHNLISNTRDSNYQWLKNNVFDGLAPSEWEEKYARPV